MNPSPNLAEAIREFNLSGEPQVLPGGSTANYRIGDIVLKRIRETSLENDHSPELAAWIAGFTAGLPHSGFRLPQPRPTLDGAWITANGWIATSFVAGQHATPQDIFACIPAIQALHQALAPIAPHPLMKDNRTAWGLAHQWCWEDKPAQVQVELQPLIDRLYDLRQPISTSPWQLIHADLNPENILVAPGLPPAFLDFSPFWGPPEFATAIFANFSGPRRRDMAVLRHFMHLPNFTQLLIRAAIRMLLVLAVLDGLDGWETCEEKWAAEHIIELAAQ
jgi:Ser/Thr protein kinase RdoA (MazF antagonist)